ncbi:MAG TPA: glycosyltransferase family 2 protein [Solirubrobacterales bacterium]|nr:glycosyltransferase family 2 protein [Solirubrobacterales bacterium]
MPALPDVSVLVPVLNEAAVIERTAAAMRGQRVDGTVELLFVDGGSDDGTRALLQRLAAEDDSIRILDNPSRGIPAGLNIGLREARGEFVARMDAHTTYPPGYLAKGVDRLRRGDVDWVSGPALAEGTNAWSESVALALSVRLGVGGARFRFPQDREIDVDTGFTGVWRRSTLEALGGWDEEWPVNEDSELAARVRERGGRIVCIPEMAARYAPRRSIIDLARQYWTYGQFRAKTSRHHPESMRRSNLLPPTLAAVAAASVIAPRPVARLARRLLATYGLCLIGESARQAARGHRTEAALLPAVLATMHFSWGAGFLLGCVKFGPPVEAIRSALGLGKRG